MTHNSSQLSGELHQVGGSLKTDDPTYVVRQADEALYSLLKRGEFCYVLNSRQMGKSSLRVQVMKRLQNNAACASIDITTFGGNENKPDRWYAVLMRNLASELHLEDAIELGPWLQQRNFLTPVQRLKEFIETVVLAELSQDIVIFVDEIDKIISLPFSTDDFFAFIRSCYNLRADNPEYRRLTFALFGVASPSDLVGDKTVTPFNIGRSIQLRGFQLEEAQPLEQALQRNADDASSVLKAILDWTGGQPFLTQKVCQLVDDLTRTIDAGSERSIVDRLVTSRIIEKWESQDVPVHLKTIRDRLLRSQRRASRLLGLYQKILEEGKVAIDDSYDQVELRLSGLVTERDGYLCPYNKIYSAVFDARWVAKELAKLRPYSEALLAWFDSGCQDESRLLRGQALKDAMRWATDKSLTDKDYLFLSTSQESALNIERGSKQVIETALEETKQRLATVKARRWTRNLFVFCATFLMSLLAFIGILNGILESRAISEQKENLEKAGADLLQRFEDIGSTSSNKLREIDLSEIDLLVRAMLLGQEQQALAAEHSLTGPPPAKPRLALQTILDNIRQRNQIDRHRGSVNDFQLDSHGHLLVSVGDEAANLWHLTDHQHIELAGHDGAISRVRFSPDEERIATAASDGTIRLWASDGQQLTTFFNQTDRRMIDISFSPDERWLATADAAGVASLWRFDGFLRPVEFRGHDGRINQVQFSPDGQQLITAGDDGTLRFWNLEGLQLQELRGHAGWINDVELSPNGKRLATGGVDGTARLWGMDGGSDPVVLNGHDRWVNVVRFSPDGEQLATVGDDGIARLWDMGGQLQVEFRGDEEQPERLNDVQFSSDGDLLVTASDDGSAYLWDVAGHRLAEFHGHQGRVLQARFTPNNREVVTTGEDGTIRFWAIRENDQTDTLDHEVWLNNVRFHPDGQRLATAGIDGTVRLWTLDGDLLAELDGHEGWVNGVQFSPHGQRMVTAGDSGIAYLWDMEGNRLAEFSGHDGWINDVQFSPHQNIVATAGVDGTARLWNLEGEQLAEFYGHEGWVNSVQFSRDGNVLATAGSDGTARLWDLDGNLQVILSGHKGWVSDIQFSPNGNRLVTAGRDGTARLWRADGQALGTMADHNGWVRSVQFSPDGQRLVSTGEDGTAILWNLSQEKLATLSGHDGWVVDARFSPDGEQLVTAGVDGTVRLWDLEGRQLAEFLAHEGWINDVRFSPDGERLAAARDDGTASLVAVDSMSDLLDRGCDWLESYLANHPQELEQLVSCHDDPMLLSNSAPVLVDDALRMAEEQGDRDRSIASLETALEWNPTVDLDPQTDELESDPEVVAERYLARFEAD